MWRCTTVSLKDNGIGTKGKEGEYMKAWRRGIACVTVVAMLVCGMSFVETQAASTIKLSTSKVTLTVGKTTRIRVKNYKKKVIWSSAKKSVAAVTSVGKYVGKVKAKKAGSTKIYAKCGNKKLVCKVTVKKQSTPTDEDVDTSKTTVTAKPTTAPTTKATTKPGTSVNANQKYLADQSLEYDEEEGMYHLYFSIKLSDNQTRKEYAGKVDLEVYNSQQELVYNQSKSFTADDFVEEEKDEEDDNEDGDTGRVECLCDIEIPASEFLAGSSSEGVLYYSISLEDDTWFSKRTLDIDYLPVRVTEKPTQTLTPVATKVPEEEPTNLVETPVPTIESATEKPVETMVPTDVPNTKEPTTTPEISKAPTTTPEPTDTPSPTETVAPTDTPNPTETPSPTETVKPTNTPTITPTPTPEVVDTRDEILERNIQTLREYIIINGDVDSNGNFCLEWQGEDGLWKYQIACNLITDEILYSVSGPINGYEAVLVMESNPFANDRSILKCSCTSADLSKSGKAMLSFENLSYSRFAAKAFYVMGDISDNDMQNVANVLWYSGMEVWNNKLDEIELSLKQLGYDNYGNVELEEVDTKYPVSLDATTALDKWKKYIQSMGEEMEEEVYRIYIKDGTNVYYISYDAFHDLFIYGMDTGDESASLTITIDPDVQSYSKIIYEEVDIGSIYTNVNVKKLTGTEKLTFQAEEEGWVEQMEQNANVYLWKCYANWSCMAQCAGMTLNQVGFDNYGC